MRVAARAVTELTGKEKDEAVDRLKRVMSSYIQQEAEYKAGIAAQAVVKWVLGVPFSVKRVSTIGALMGLFSK